MDEVKHSAEDGRNIRAIFCDFDWTLFDHNAGDFNRQGVLGLREAHDRGVKLIINSARTYHSIKGLHTFDLIPFDGFVVANGGACMIDGKTLYADFIPDADRDAILSELDRLGLGYNLIGQYATFIKVTYQEYVTDFYRVFREPYPLDISLYQGESILSIQVFSRQESDPELSALAARYHVTFNRFADTNVEMSAKEFLKSKGVDTIYRYLNLKPEEAMAFGDDLNDISMFNKVKYSVCMGNGKPLAKQAAYYVTDRIEEGGLYKALRHFGVID